MTTIADFPVAGRAVARLDDGAQMATELSPRPFFEAFTVGGLPVTDTHTSDHPHHYGLSLALPDVDGVSHWGGNTYVRGVGSTLLDNHGRQQITDRRAGHAGVGVDVAWHRPDGTVQLNERRTLAVSAEAGGWMLEWASELSPVEGRVTLGSPQTNGRPGAFYGGLFWRTPFTDASIATADGSGIEIAHGSSSPWLALTSADASIVAWADGAHEWFVRTEGYVGFCPAVAVDERRVIERGDSLCLGMRVVVVDGRISASELAVVVRTLEERSERR